MYRLTVVAGPNRGATYPLHEGETTIGRLSLNSVVLNSSRVSKKHCSVVITNDDVVCSDQGSSNGTFINGVLTKVPRRLQPGDRIGVGDFVLELSRTVSGVSADAVALPVSLGGAGAYAGASGRSSTAGLPVIPVPGAPSVESAAPVDVAPSELGAKLLWIFERRVMGHLYPLLLKYEWRTLLGGVFAVFTLLALLFAVAPLIQSNEVMMIRELERRARFMAQQVVEVNISRLQQRQEAATEIPSTIERALGVRQALLVDMNSRILAPAERSGQTLTTGTAAVAAVKARAEFIDNGRLKTFTVPVGSHTVVAVEPLVLYSARDGRNVAVAMGIVSLDADLVTQGAGEVAMIYAESLIWLVMVGVILALVVYRLTLKPLQVLNEDIDRCLKGQQAGVTREIRFSELGQLQDIMETLLQRVAQQVEGESRADAATGSLTIGDECLHAFRMLGSLLPGGMVFCDSDRRVLYANEAFEVLTGIRADNAFMQRLSEQARDQAFAAFVEDLMDRAPGSSEGVEEEFEFSGVPHRVRAVMLGAFGSEPRGFVLAAARSGDG